MKFMFASAFPIFLPDGEGGPGYANDIVNLLHCQRVTQGAWKWSSNADAPTVYVLEFEGCKVAWYYAAPAQRETDIARLLSLDVPPATAIKAVTPPEHGTAL